MASTIETVEHQGAELEAVKELWSEYWQSLGFSSEFQGFALELAALPGKYAPPHGRLLLLRIDGEPAGTAAFRPLHEDACEIKRLFVRPARRGRGAARALMERLLQEARTSGYRNLYADTLPVMTAALDLYRRLGFEEVEPYADDPTPGAVYLRLAITS
jgi:GNAT superfamily N-acetyltransferase